MTGLVRKATLFVVCAAIFGTVAAYAGLVSPGNCTVGSTRINLVGTSSTASDPNNSSDSLEINTKLTITGGALNVSGGSRAQPRRMSWRARRERRRGCSAGSSAPGSAASQLR